MTIRLIPTKLGYLIFYQKMNGHSFHLFNFNNLETKHTVHTTRKRLIRSFLLFLTIKGSRVNMSLTLDTHLDSLFHHGLSIMRKHEQEILQEWTQMKDYFEETGKRSSEAITYSVDLFTNIIFNDSLDKDILLTKIKECWKRRLGNKPIDQFILTMLESSVHHATKLKTEDYYKKHQAIQYVFNQINEHLLTSEDESPFTYDLFLQHLVYSQQLPIEWVAVIIKKDDSYKVSKWFDKNKCLLGTHNDIKAQSMYKLTEDLLQFVCHDQTKNILTIPFEDKQLLLSAEVNGTVHITPFINHALQLLQSGKSTLTVSRKEQQWKDAVIMFNESILRARNFNDALETITEGFVNYLPFERCAIFSYSKTDELGFGLSAHRLDNDAIQAITQDINNLPLINNGIELLRMFGKALKYLQPLYIANASNEFPKEYIKSFQLKSIVVTPIFTSSSNELIGAAIIDQGANKEFEISQDIYQALIKFGQSAGEALEKFHSSIHEVNKTVHFSPREIEVLNLMAAGESTTGAADILHLSEYTVRDYITSIMQKMKARNRTEAVARAIRKGVI